MGRRREKASFKKLLLAFLEVSHVTDINCLTNHSLKGLKPRKAAQLKMINRSLHDCKKSLAAPNSSLLSKFSITLDVESEDDSLRLPNKKYSTTLRYIISKHVLNPTDNACNSCLETPAHIRSRALQRAKYPNNLIHDKELQSQEIAERVLTQRYTAQKCILIRITGR